MYLFLPLQNDIELRTVVASKDSANYNAQGVALQQGVRLSGVLSVFLNQRKKW